MSLPASRPAVRARMARLLAVLCVPGLLMLANGSEAYADSSSPGPVSSDTYRPAVSFTALEYPVSFYGRIFNADEPTHRWWPQPTDTRTWFGHVVADARSEDLNLSFAVEGQHDPSGYQFCETPEICDGTSGQRAKVNVRVTPTGLLYRHKEQRTSFQNGYWADFPIRTVELSASDAATELKVYREVLVGPPDRVTGCEDYGENNPDAFTCLFLRELLPSDAPTGVSESTLRADLPGLVQDESNYELVFSEEFDGTPPPANEAGCRDGYSTLDNDAWNHTVACDNVDSRGEPCGNIVDGAFVMADSGSCPGSGLGTHGKVHAKYGYFELKYTINMDRWSAYGNYNFVLITQGEKLRFLLDRYGVELEDWEDYLTNLDIEIDIVEHETHARQDVAHQYGNPGFFIRNADLAPIRTSKWNRFCSAFDTITVNPNLPCRPSKVFTVTRGIEWTPRGYRTFIKVDGIHDDMIVVPKERITVQTQRVAGNRVVSGWRSVTGSAKDRYFEYVDPDDTDTILEQVVVSHVPLPLAFGAWGWFGPQAPYIRTRMKIDYVRVWQPTNHYSDMEPVYQ